MEKATTSMNPGKPDPIREKSFQFAVRIVNLYRHLTEKKKEFCPEQADTSVGHKSWRNDSGIKKCGERPGFIHKLGVAQKEIGETQYWLELLSATGFINEPEFKSLNLDSEEIMKLIRSSIVTKKKNITAKK